MADSHEREPAGFSDPILVAHSVTDVVDGQQHKLRECSLPPVDRGKDAWLCLLSCFFIEALVWGANLNSLTISAFSFLSMGIEYLTDITQWVFPGLPFSFGVFQDYYTTHEPFIGESSGVAVIGSCALGITYFLTPAVFFILQRYPQIRRLSSVLGLGIASAGLVASSFATQVWHLIFTQGVIYAIGGGLLYYPTMLFINEWFVKRKGLAFGIVWAGTGFSGVTVPFIAAFGLSRFSFRVMLRAWAIIMVAIAGPLLLFLKPRLSSAAMMNRRRPNFRFTLSRTFLILQLGNVIQGLGYFAPSIYLQTYSRSLGLTGAATTAPVTLLNAGTFIGSIVFGLLIDLWHATNVIMISTISTSFTVFVVWGLSVSILPLYTFALLYGIFAGGFTSTWPGMVQEVRKVDGTAQSDLILGLLAAGRGIGSIACGPLSEALLQQKPWVGKAVLGYGTGYGSLIVFTGTTAMLAGLVFGAQRLGYLCEKISVIYRR